MRDPDRIDRILEKIARAWKTVPEWRLGQLLSNTRGLGPQDVFYYEDSDLEAALDAMLAGPLDHELGEKGTRLRHE